MVLICVLTDILILSLLMIPVFYGIGKGFVKIVFRFGKTVLAFFLASFAADPLGAFLKNRFLYVFVSEKIAALFENGGANDASALVVALPQNFKSILAICGVDVNILAQNAAAQSEFVIGRFVDGVSEAISGALAFAIAFAGAFFAAWLFIRMLTPLVDSCVGKIPVVKTCNKGLGALLGFAVGMIIAWIGARVIVSVGGVFFGIDFAKTYLLSFFYRVSPLSGLLVFV